MLNQPKISVIIPTYNRKKMLRRAIDSVLAQDYKNIEVIVSDNASTDGTDTLMQEYADDSRIIYIRNSENIGPVKNGKQAYLKAAGKYIMILCDDDYMLGTTIFSKAIKVMEKHSSIALVRGICRIDHASTPQGEFMPAKYSILTKGLDFFYNYEQLGFPHIDGFFGIVRKEILNDSNVLMWETFGHDRWMWRVAPLYGDVYFIDDEIFGVYNYHEQGQESNNSYVDSLEQIVYATEKILELARKKHPNHQFQASTVEAAWISKYWLHNYKLKYGTIKFIKMLSTNKLRHQYPKIYWYLIRVYLFNILNRTNTKILVLIRKIMRI